MKILLLIGCKRFSFSRRINSGFVEKLQTLPGVEKLWVYDFRTIRNALAGSGKTLLTLYQQLCPDIVICYAKAGKFNMDDLRQMNCAKVMIDVDYYKEPKSKCETYKRCKFDLVLQRGAFSVPLGVGIPSIWLPFSADDKLFYPLNPTIPMIPLVGFAGSISSSIYHQRKIAVSRLLSSGLLKNCKKCYTDMMYTKFLREMKICLTSSELNSPHGKMFEIMASGSVVLTPPFYGEKELFGIDPCFVRYNRDGSDIVHKANLYLKKPKLYNILRNNSYKIFKEKHTDDIRLQELYKHLENLLQGKPIWRPWGI